MQLDDGDARPRHVADRPHKYRAAEDNEWSSAANQAKRVGGWPCDVCWQPEHDTRHANGGKG